MGNIQLKLDSDNTNNNAVVSNNDNNNDPFNFKGLPQDIQNIIIEFAAGTVIFNLVNKEVFSGKEIKHVGKEILNLSLVCKYFKNTSAKFLKDIKSIHILYNKYSSYNIDYLRPGCGWQDHRKLMVPRGNPQLLDLLTTGRTLAIANRSFHEFSKEQEDDFKEIIRLMPRSLQCNMGDLKCRSFVKPIVMACFNEQVPLHVIEILLKNGANPNETLIFNERKIHVLVDLKSNNLPRYNEVKSMMEKYGAIEKEFEHPLLKKAQ